MVLATDYSDGPSGKKLPASDYNAHTTQTNTNTTNIAANTADIVALEAGGGGGTPTIVAGTGLVDFGFNQSELGHATWYSTEDNRRILEGIKAAGATRVRCAAWWGSFEPTTRGTFQWAGLDRAMNLCEEYGLELMVVITSPAPSYASPTVADYANACRALAARYGAQGTGQCSHYEIWNEANARAYYGPFGQDTTPPYSDYGPAHYSNLLISAASAIRSVDSEAFIISAGLMSTVDFAPNDIAMTTFLQGMYDNGAKNYFDAVGLHWYSNEVDFSGWVEPTATETFYLQLLACRDIMVAEGDADKNMWLTEIGLPEPDLEASVRTRWLAQKIELLRPLDYVETFLIYNYRCTDDSMVGGSQYGMVTYDFEERQPYFDTIASINRLVKEVPDKSVTTEKIADLSVGPGQLNFTGTPDGTKYPAGDGVWRVPAGAGGGGTPDWDDVIDKPTTFPPSTHTHDYTTGISGKPATYPPSTHSHPTDFVDVAHHLPFDGTDWPARPADSRPAIYPGGVYPFDEPPGLLAGDVWLPTNDPGIGGGGGGGSLTDDGTGLFIVGAGSSLTDDGTGLFITGGSQAIVFNVKDYDAIGDGTANDTTAINAAITAAPNGATVYFPPGTYKITGVLNITKPLRLAGAGFSSLLKLGAAADFIGLSNVADVIIEDLAFDGNRSVVGPSYQSVIYMDDVTSTVVRNCRFANTIGVGIAVTRGHRITITGCQFTNTYWAGIRLNDPVTASTYNEDIWITDNYFDQTQQSGAGGHAAIQSHGTDEVSHRRIHVTDNVVYRPEIVGIGLDSLDQSNVTGNTIIKDGTCSPGEAIAFTGAENVISDNYCRNDATSSGASILIWVMASRTNDHNQIINNRCTNGGQGIGFVWADNGAAVNDLLIQGNHCYGNNIGVQSYAMGGVSSGSQTDVLIANNDLTGNTTGPITIIANSGGITGAPTELANLGAWHLSRHQVITPSATPAINTDITDVASLFSLAANVTSMTTNLTGTPSDGDSLTIRFQDTGSPRTIAWGAKFRGNLLTTTNTYQTHVQELVYSGGHAQWAGTFVDTTGY